MDLHNFSDLPEAISTPEEVDLIIKILSCQLNETVDGYKRVVRAIITFTFRTTFDSSLESKIES